MSIHVTKHPRGWQVKSAGAKRAYRVVKTQAEALAIAKRVATNKNTDAKIHKTTGSIREGRNYSKKK